MWHGRAIQLFGPMTLEMPFKDTIETPHPVEGWSPDRCHNLGASCIDAIYAVIDEL
ncbi:MAG: hypothetical protein Q9M92_09290 [Enterobacterales bacterium]|nr:hypothetical protein [Enterobacterales bacterium]